jgi:hypothetical protein
MYVGIPPVIFDQGGPARMVANGNTGIVVDNEDDYVAAIEWLFRNPHERKRIGENAAASMRRRAQLSAGQTDAIYLQLMEHPKRPRSRIVSSDFSDEDLTGKRSYGAWSFLRSLDETGDADFVASLTSIDDAQAEAAEVRIGHSNTSMQHVILQYRFYEPHDRYLRLWAGLVLQGNGRHGLAASEFKASIALGFDRPRIFRYLAESITTANSSTRADFA